jgi:hypothetical protein
MNGKYMITVRQIEEEAAERLEKKEDPRPADDYEYFFGENSHTQFDEKLEDIVVQEISNSDNKVEKSVEIISAILGCLSKKEADEVKFQII